MRIFLDSSVVLAACGSDRGASSYLFAQSDCGIWELLVSPYVLSEVTDNLNDLPPAWTSNWKKYRTCLSVVDDVTTIPHGVVFPAKKDRPILFSAFAFADLLLVLDVADFGPLMGTGFYSLPVMTPGLFLKSLRESGELPRLKS
ncbi:MAG: hypothetical protein WEB53_02390 [Akkermansiaceae bacterium]